MAPYEALYVRKCRSLLCCAEVGEREPLEPDLFLETTKKIKLIQQRIQTAHSNEKIYADSNRKHLKFKVGHHVFLKLSPLKGVMRFGKKEKFSPKYFGPFVIIDRVEAMAYELALPPQFASVHPVLHVSLMRKYVSDLSHVLASKSI